MLTSILRFEWRLGTRQASFYLAAAAFLAMGFGVAAGGYGPPDGRANSPMAPMLAMGLLSLPAIFAATVFCAAAALRDTEHRMAEIVFATPVGRTRYVLGRFGGSVLVAATAFAFAPLGMAAAQHLAAIPPERLGPPDWASPFLAFLILGLPNLVLVCAAVFAVAALTRSALAAYVAAVFLYAGYFLCAYLLASPLMAGAAPASVEMLARAALLDPFGISAVAHQARAWTAAERDARPVVLAGRLLANRALWLAVACAMLAVTHRFAALRVAGGARSARASDPAEPAPALAYRPVHTDADRWSVLRAEARLQSGYVLRNRAFLALLALWAAAAWGNMGAGEAAEYGSRLLPRTEMLLATAAQMLAQLGPLVLVYFGAELAWRERTLRFADVLDATPAPSAAFFVGRLAALAAAVGALVVAASAVAVAVQIARGHPRWDPALHLAFWARAGAPLLAFAVAALAAQAVSPNRYVGMLLAAGIAFLSLNGAALGLEHPLLRIGGAPAVPRSEMARTGQAAASHDWFLLYWTLFAAMLAFGTAGAWRRGAASLGGRLRAIPARLGRAGRMGALACAALFAATGLFLFHQTAIANEYRSADAEERWRAEYERAYRAAASGPEPAVVAVRSRVDLFPEERRFATRGTLRLRNTTAVPLRTVWVGVERGARGVRLSLDGAPPAVRDARLGMYAFRLPRPLAPGAEAELSFAWTRAQRGIRADGFDLSVVENGSLVRHGEAFPLIGYRPSLELDDPVARREHGLPARPPRALAAEDNGAEEAVLARATFDGVVSTSADQTAVAPGELAGEWRSGGRRFFRYTAARPVTPRFAFVSARYAVRRTRHQGIAVEVYHHPAHGANVDRMLRAATQSLALFGRELGPYPGRTLRIVEVPAYWGFGAYALPGMILFPESRGFLTDTRDTARIDLVARRVAHEVSHQWWGHQVSAGARPGASTLTESLAKYSEQMVIRALHGDAHAARVVEADLARYAEGRARDRDAEPPLSRVTSQQYLYYGKGAVVMHGLRDLLGEPTMNRALRRMVREHATPESAPDVRTLVRNLQAEARPEDRPRIAEWLDDVVVYDLRVDSARAREAPGGFAVTAHVTAARFRHTGGGTVPLPLDEWLELEADGAITRHRVRSGPNVLRTVVRSLPREVRLDPRALRVEIERGDNVRPVRP